MELIKLSKRLRAIADFVPKKANVADVGTDHGYIPVWLAQNHIAERIVAADINRGPLDHAMETASRYGVSHAIRFALCSGLSFEGSDAYDTIIVAGMGGELIASILEEAPWTNREGTTLILQPNSRIPHLVYWLTDHGFKISDVSIVKDAGKLYQILVVQSGKAEPILSEPYALVNRLYFEKKDPLLGEYLDSLLKRYMAAERGMQSGKSEDSALRETQIMIAALKDMKKEVEAWQL
ncbi:MAG: SAM-dependent methyltransferase [Oscillospiraceae bacterium]|nr:SAM-dependent methyltransferase [Oscillospiraceae bacterium]